MARSSAGAGGAEGASVVAGSLSLRGRVLSRPSRCVTPMGGESFVRGELAAEQDVHRIVERARSGVVPLSRPAVSGVIDFDVSTADRAISFKRLEAWYRRSDFTQVYPDFSSFLAAVERGEVKFSSERPVSKTRRAEDSPRNRRESDKKDAETSAVVAEVVAALGKRERASSSE